MEPYLFLQTESLPMAAFLVTEFGMSYGTACASLISIVVLYVVLPRRSIISSIPGPPSPSWILGEVIIPVVSRAHYVIFRAYASVVATLNVRRL
jgi:hypothetical protein